MTLAAMRRAAAFDGREDRDRASLLVVMILLTVMILSVRLIRAGDLAPSAAQSRAARKWSRT